MEEAAEDLENTIRDGIERDAKETENNKKKKGKVLFLCLILTLLTHMSKECEPKQTLTHPDLMQGQVSKANTNNDTNPHFQTTRVAVVQRRRVSSRIRSKPRLKLEGSCKFLSNLSPSQQRTTNMHFYLIQPVNNDSYIIKIRFHVKLKYIHVQYQSQSLVHFSLTDTMLSLIAPDHKSEEGQIGEHYFYRYQSLSRGQPRQDSEQRPDESGCQTAEILTLSPSSGPPSLPATLKTSYTHLHPPRPPRTPVTPIFSNSPASGRYLGPYCWPVGSDNWRWTIRRTGIYGSKDTCFPIVLGYIVFKCIFYTVLFMTSLSF